MLSKLSIKDVDLKDKTVFIRVDFNVPKDKSGAISNTARIEAALPTLKYALEKGAKKLVLCSHLGRPKGKGFEAEFSLKIVAEALEKLAGEKVLFLNDCVGDEIEKQIKEASEKLILLENVRFHAEEEAKDENAPNVKEFRAKLRKLADIYVDDAFGTAHRAHSSMVGEGYEIRCAGLLLQKELDYFSVALENPQKPYLNIVGGKKVSDKILLLKNLMKSIDKLIICGGMSYTFLKVLGKMDKLGNSIYDEAGAKIVPEIMEEAKKYNVEIIFPVDFVCGDDFKNDCNLKDATVESGIPDGFESMDCGPKSRELFKNVIKNCKTVIWNGPAGCAEFENFSNGTRAICEACGDVVAAGGVTIIGGGDSAALAMKMGYAKNFSHISTGGGSTIELLEGKVLPGLDRLSDKK